MESPLKQTVTSIFQSATARLIMITFLSLFLLIPLEFVKSIINERSQRKQEVVDEVANLWGKDVQFYGPMLKIPYKTIVETEVEDDKTKKTTIQRKLAYDFVYFFSETLNNKSNIKKNTSLKRGIYNNVVFTANMNFDGNFAKLNYQKLGIKPEDIVWEKAVIVVKTTNLKSIKSDLKIKLNDQILSFESKPSKENDIYGTLESDFFDYKLISKNENINYSFNMLYNGSNSVNFIPVGKITTVNIDSDWESPSFDGAFSKNDTTFTSNPKGFHADWKVLEINRPFSQQFTTKIPNLVEYSFGVKLIETVNEYQQNERVSKYGFLVIALTFFGVFYDSIVQQNKNSHFSILHDRPRTHYVLHAINLNNRALQLCLGLPYCIGFGYIHDCFIFGIHFTKQKIPHIHRTIISRVVHLYIRNYSARELRTFSRKYRIIPDSWCNHVFFPKNRLEQ